MKRVIITLSSQDTAQAMKELNKAEFQLTAEQGRSVVSPTKIENNLIKEQTTEPEVIAENSYNTWKSSCEENEVCDRCKVHVCDKELEAKKFEVEALKAKLEEELFERIKVEDEFVLEKEHFEAEILKLRARIEELEEETSWRIEDLENNNMVLTTENENARDEIAHIKGLLERTVSENTKLRNNESFSDDRIIEILDELEVWKKKAYEIEERGNTSRINLQDEIETNEKEIRELKETLEETRQLNETKRRLSLQEITCNCGDFDNSKSDTTANKSENLTISNEKQMLELSSELNELYRDHVDYQDKYFALNQELISKEKELDELRGDYESQNIEIQNLKERYAELKDVVLATKQENAHLQNRVDKKSDEYKELKKKHLVQETEITWLRDALGLINSTVKH